MTCAVAWTVLVVLLFHALGPRGWRDLALLPTDGSLRP